LATASITPAYPFDNDFIKGYLSHLAAIILANDFNNFKLIPLG